MFSCRIPQSESRGKGHGACCCPYAQPLVLNIEVSFTAVWSLGDQSTNNDPLLESLRADVSLCKSETSKLSHACNQSGGDPPQKNSSALENRPIVFLFMDRTSLLHLMCMIVCYD